MQKSDEQLMQQYRSGDSKAFDALYLRFNGPVYRYIKRLCRDCTESEELYQDVWIRMVRARDQWNEQQTFSPWLYRIAHNRVMDHWRSIGKADFVDIDEMDDRAQNKAVPDVIALLQDCVERLQALLGVLPEVQRSAFLLKEETGLSLVQIGEVTGVKRETVKSRLRYALQYLRKELEGCND